jgi:hypothetical protein
VNHEPNHVQSAVGGRDLVADKVAHGQEGEDGQKRRVAEEVVGRLERDQVGPAGQQSKSQQRQVGIESSGGGQSLLPRRWPVLVAERRKRLGSSVLSRSAG